MAKICRCAPQKGLHRDVRDDEADRPDLSLDAIPVLRQLIHRPAGKSVQTPPPPKKNKEVRINDVNVGFNHPKSTPSRFPV